MASLKYNNCYIKDSFSIVGPMEKMGQIKSYDIDESGCYPGSAGRWIAAFGCVIAAAVIVIMSLRLISMPVQIKQ